MIELIKQFWNSKSRTTIMGYIAAIITLIATGVITLDFLPATWIKPTFAVFGILYAARQMVSGYVQQDSLKFKEVQEKPKN